MSELDEGDEGELDREDEGPDTVLWRNSSHISAASHISPAPQGWLQMGEDGDTLPRLESAFIPNLSAF